MNRILKRVLRALWIVAGLSFTAWMYLGFQASGVADNTLETDESVAVVRSEKGIEFHGLTNPQRSGVIFLPGGMVEPIAYAPLLRKIAKAGHMAHLLYLPMRCACTASQTKELFQNIQQVMEAEPRRAWILAGHSRGAMLAARFVHAGSKGPAALVLIGTTHPRDFSMTESTVAITKIYGTRDGIASYAAMQQNQHLLPPNTNWVEIAGGNHVQFGFYRHQLGDNDATISRDEQHGQVERAILHVLANVGVGRQTPTTAY